MTHYMKATKIHGTIIYEIPSGFLWTFKIAIEHCHLWLIYLYNYGDFPELCYYPGTPHLRSSSSTSLHLKLVGGFNQPLWKMMELVSWDYYSQYDGKNKSHVPNHQSAKDYKRLTSDINTKCTAVDLWIDVGYLQPTVLWNASPRFVAPNRAVFKTLWHSTILLG